MRNEFPGYYSLNDAQFDALWADGLIVFDSSALLNMYRYSVSTASQYLTALKEKADQLWIPRQVGIEYHRNRDSVIQAQHGALDRIAKEAEDAHTKLESTITSFKRHPSLDTSELTVALRKSRKILRKALKAARVRHEDLVRSSNSNDTASEAISDLYEGRIGRAWSEDELTALYKEGGERYEKKQPPGFRDAAKSEPEKYGDLVLWRQLLEHAEAERKPAIFVTDDQKDDWWLTVNGDIKGAHPDLVAEFQARSGQPIAFLTSERFLKIALDKGAKVSEDAVEEVKTRSRPTAVTMARIVEEAAPELTPALRQRLREIAQTYTSSPEYMRSMSSVAETASRLAHQSGGLSSEQLGRLFTGVSSAEQLARFQVQTDDMTSRYAKLLAASDAAKRNTSFVDWYVNQQAEDRDLAQVFHEGVLRGRGEVDATASAHQAEDEADD
ncbi:PIN domain-containing protein [Microbacterium testaceum]|uniref:PIN like domain-containing protein n=1 Tax=Microbacterium testaceum TaxID=2033 RepID=A0A2T7WCJ1_MICTE|nr:PIN domain-containing protein [Microbacterium testaceum]PVE67920.1 hypothetical protein DC432_12230 [Microbacterium testaceum]